MRVNIRDCTSNQVARRLRDGWPLAQADPARPRYHFCPMSGWMNDPNGGIWADGAYHFFYLQDPFDAGGRSPAVLYDGTNIGGNEKPNRFWAHARTKDFKTWEYLPAALVPDRGNQEIKPISGSVIRRRDGSYFMAFTSVRSGSSRYCQWGAFSCDGLMTWVRMSGELMKPPAGIQLEGDWRDPYLFLHDDRYFMTVAAVTEQDALLLLYEAAGDSLEQWDYRGIMLSRSRTEVDFFECPKLFYLSGKMVLLFSPYRQVEYYVGDFDAGAGIFHVSRQGYVDYGRVAYATVDVRDEYGDTYLLSWAPGWFTEKPLSFDLWSGCITVPRMVRLDEEGRMIQRVCGQMKTLRDYLLPVNMEAEDGFIAKRVLPQFELQLKADMLPLGGWTLEFFDADTGESIQRLELQDETVTIDGAVIPITGDGVDLVCFCDGFLWEYFLDEGRAVITSGTATVPDAIDICLKQTHDHSKTTGIIAADLWKIMDAQYEDCML